MIQKVKKRKKFQVRKKNKPNDMKSMTCNQLGGACDKVFRAESFEEMARLSKAHGTEMFKQGDKAHLAAMNKMRELMHTPNAMEEWFASKRKMFDELPSD